MTNIARQEMKLNMSLWLQLICLTVFTFLLFCSWAAAAPKLQLKFLLPQNTAQFAHAYFIDPFGVAVDSNGYIFVADTYNKRIQKFSSSGNLLLAWGSYASGNGQFYEPRGVGVDRQGNP